MVGSYIATDSGEAPHVPIVFDTGCSMSITPFISDFVGPIEETDIKELTAVKDTVPIKGSGLVEWTIEDWNHQVGKVQTRAYYVPESTIRLCSPQVYFAENEGGHCEFDHTKLDFHLADGQTLQFGFCCHTNIPLMRLFHDPAHQGPGAETFLGRALCADARLREQVRTLLNDNNHNLTRSQKELALWHARLAHAGQGWIQDLMFKVKHQAGEAEQPVIPVRQDTTARCPHIKCPACQMAKQHRRTPDSSTMHQNPDLEMALRHGDLHPGDRVLMDQYVCRQLGRLPHTYGREDQSTQYTGGTIFVDHASQYIWVNHQISLRVGDTLRGKHAFEDFAKDFGIKIKSYHSDNHPFRAAEFLEDLQLLDQTITYSGVGAHHANGVSERAIKTITTWARAMMMHQLLHWPSRFNTNLWPFAMDHAVYIWNHLPRSRNGLSPLELFTSLKEPNYDPILRARVWGCPVYVLNPKLQDGKKLPKWTKRSRLGMYLGNSPKHSSSIGLIGNLDTGAVSPKYHVVYDELFTSVHGDLTEAVFDADEWSGQP